MAQAPDLTAADVMALCESYMNEKHVAFVKKALDFATEAHKEQFRLHRASYSSCWNSRPTQDGP